MTWDNLNQRAAAQTMRAVLMEDDSEDWSQLERNAAMQVGMCPTAVAPQQGAASQDDGCWENGVDWDVVSQVEASFFKAMPRESAETESQAARKAYRTPLSPSQITPRPADSPTPASGRPSKRLLCGPGASQRSDCELATPWKVITPEKRPRIDWNDKRSSPQGASQGSRGHSRSANCARALDSPNASQGSFRLSGSPYTAARRDIAKATTATSPRALAPRRLLPPETHVPEPPAAPTASARPPSLAIPARPLGLAAPATHGQLAAAPAQQQQGPGRLGAARAASLQSRPSDQTSSPPAHGAPNRRGHPSTPAAQAQQCTIAGPAAPRALPHWQQGPAQDRSAIQTPSLASPTDSAMDAVKTKASASAPPSAARSAAPGDPSSEPADPFMKRVPCAPRVPRTLPLSTLETDDLHRQVQCYLESRKCSERDNADLAKILAQCLPKLRAYQKVGIARMLELRGRCLVYDEMGLGKTLQTMIAALVLAYTQDCWPVLIVCPASLRKSWFEALETWAPAMPLEDIALLESSSSIVPQRSRVIIVGYRGAARFYRELKAARPQVVIADEVHHTRTHSSQTSTTLLELAREARHVMLLSGTPMLIRPFEIFTQVNIMLDPCEKEGLMRGWGAAQAGAAPAQSCLAQMLQRPLKHLAAIAYLLRLDCSAQVARFGGAARPEDPIAFVNEWNAQSVELKRSVIKLLSALSREVVGMALKHALKSTPSDSPAAMAPLRTTITKLGNEGTIPSWRSATCPENVILRLTRLQQIWQAVQQDRSTFIPAATTLANMWDAHRFGVVFCVAERRRSFQNRGGGTSWAYKGSHRGNLRALRATLEPLIIRRRKADVLGELPRKTRAVRFLEESQESKKSSKHFREFEGMTPADYKEAAITVELGRGQGLSATEAAHRLKLPPGELVHRLRETAIGKCALVGQYVVELLERLDPEEKVLVFAHHLKLTHGIHEYLRGKAGNDPKSPDFARLSSKTITGSTPIPERDDIVKQFQSGEQGGPRVLVLSMLAMGTGFTLTNCSHVVMAELHWSPQVLLQAEDRVHRIGQRKAVNIEYLLAKDTVEVMFWPLLSSRLAGMERTIERSASSQAAQAPTTAEHAQALRRQPASPRTLKRADQDLLALCTSAIEHETQNGVRPVGPADVRFRVSCTGRVHLYQQLSEEDRDRAASQGGLSYGEWRPLGMNCAPCDLVHLREEWDAHEGHMAALHDDVVLERIPDILQRPTEPVALQAQAFVAEWLELSPMKRNMLDRLGRPLALPLANELQHKSGDKLFTFDRTSNPALQMHRAAMKRVGAGRYRVAFVRFKLSSTTEDSACQQQAFEISSRAPLCIFCGAFYDAPHRLPADVGEEAPTITLANGPSALFCSGKAPCRAMWRIKCFQASARVHLAGLERGVCRKCSVDTMTMFNNAKVCSPGSDRRKSEIFCDSDSLCVHVFRDARTGKHHRLHWSKLQRGVLGDVCGSKIVQGNALRPGMFWEADHVLAVALGGGSAMLDNFQTLCKPCHMIKTREDQAAIRELRAQLNHHLRSAARKAAPSSQTCCPLCHHECGSLAARAVHDRICPERLILPHP